MNWSLPADLRAQVQRLWDRGELLRASVSEDAFTWPLRLTLKTPTTVDLSDRFEAVRDWVRSIADTPHVRMEWREWTHRVQGRQRLPAAAFVESLDQAGVGSVSSELSSNSGSFGSRQPTNSLHCGPGF